MIRYRLTCGSGHEFEAWFASSSTYEAEESAGRLVCPYCQRTDVSRAVMAPQIRTRRETDSAPAGSTLPVSSPPQSDTSDVKRLQHMLHEMRTLREQILSKSEYVGPRFADEARQIHFEEAPDRAIHGEATPEQVRELADDGIEVVPLPRLPDDLN